MNIHKIYQSIWDLTGFREKRIKLFLSLFKIDKYFPSILDVGGGGYMWKLLKERFNIRALNLTVLNLKIDESEIRALKELNAKIIIGNGLCLPFIDKSFDIVFSNSTIDHLSTFENQTKFADEIRRVGKGYFVQTVYKYFFFEPHYLTPFVHYFPKSIQKNIIRYFTIWGLLNKPSKQQIDKTVDEIIFSSLKEMKILFPDGKIIKEKFLCFTKSLIAYKEV